MQNIWWKMFCSHNTKQNACSTRSILSNGRQIHSTQYYDLHCIHDEAVRHQHRKSIWSTTTTKTPNQNETKTSANRHLTLLYMRHVTFMLIVEIQQRQRQKTKQNKRTNLKFRTRHIMFLMFVFIARRRHCCCCHFYGKGWEGAGKLHVAIWKSFQRFIFTWHQARERKKQKKNSN